MPFKRRAAEFLVGYGVTMIVALVAARWRSRRREPSNKPSLNSKLSGSHKRHSVRLSSSTPPSPSSAGPANWTRSTSSQMGSLQQHPRNRQSQRLGHWTMNRKVVIVMVGLPARGKSYIVKMLVRYLSWIGYPTKVFNVGNYRRKLGYGGVDKSFFDSNNEEGKRLRTQMVHHVQEEMYTWLHEDESARVALLDATNTTKSRRQMLLQRSKGEKNAMVVFVESICDDPEILAQNYRLKLKNEDYKNQDPETALRDFKQRVKAYEAVYESVEDNEDGGDIHYIKLYNVGQKVVTRNCKGYLPSQVAFYLQNIHISPRKIWLTRHAKSVISEGQGEEDTEELTEEGRRYSMTLAKYLQLEQETTKMKGMGQEILVLAGTRKVDSESVAHLQMLYPVATTPLLNDHLEDAPHDGDGTEAQKESPVAHDQRDGNRTEPRSPDAGGESYQDVIQKIRPIIVELERQQRSLVVVCHGAVQRCLYAYFMGIEVSKVPLLDLPQHQLTELIPSPFGTGCRHVSETEMMHHF